MVQRSRGESCWLFHFRTLFGTEFQIFVPILKPYFGIYNSRVAQSGLYQTQERGVERIGGCGSSLSPQEKYLLIMVIKETYAERMRFNPI